MNNSKEEQSKNKNPVCLNECGEFGYVTIPLEMLEALCHDANWKIEGIQDIKVRIFNRYFGGDYLIENPKVKSR